MDLPFMYEQDLNSIGVVYREPFFPISYARADGSGALADSNGFFLGDKD